MTRSRSQRQSRTRPHGLFALDTIMGLILLVMLSTVLAVTSARTSRASARLEAQRRAIHRAEIALTTLQQGGNANASDDLSITPLDANDAGPAPRDMRWVRVRVRIDGTRDTELIGLVPTSGGAR